MNINGKWVSIISTGRPQNVARMNHHANGGTWYVGEGEEEDYIAAGATWVKEAGGLIDSRNMALEDAFRNNLTCVQVSDDLRRLERIVMELGGGQHTTASTLYSHLDIMLNVMDDYNARLVGIAPTDNPFYYNHKRKISQDQFIVGDLIAVKPSRPRFDRAFPLKEDYDFTLQHIRTYGTIARCNDLLAEFEHRSNAGGAVDYRTEELETEAIKQLKQKWGAWIQINPRRENEVLLRLPRARTSRA